MRNEKWVKGAEGDRTRAWVTVQDDELVSITYEAFADLLRLAGFEQEADR